MTDEIGSILKTTASQMKKKHRFNSVFFAAPFCHKNASVTWKTFGV